MSLTTKPTAGTNWTAWGDSVDATVRDHETRLTAAEAGVLSTLAYNPTQPQIDAMAAGTFYLMPGE